MAASWRQTMLKWLFVPIALLSAAAAFGETPAVPALAPSSLAPPAAALVASAGSTGSTASATTVGLPGSVLSAPPADAALQTISTEDAAPQNRGPQRHWIRSKFVKEQDLAKYRLVLDEGWEASAVAQPVVVIIHGFNSTPAQNKGLVDAVRAAGLPCGTFAYPNDHTLSTAAEILSRQLREFAADHPQRKLALVCHSTGGLVARACVEDPALDPGNVDRLIMIAPPNHGSQLARFACGTDVWEHWLARKDGWPWTRLHDSVVDGLGEAADDLCPDSPFLQTLNARPRNPRVRYSILLGTRAAVSDAELLWVREKICDRLMKVPGVNGRAERLDALLADMDELVEGKGDGVVSIKRGRLEGVDDLITLHFCHLAVGRDGESAEPGVIYSAVLARLQTTP